MNKVAKALEALDRIFNYCEEIDLHIPEEEQVGYDMLVDINIIREALVNQKTGHWIEQGLSPYEGIRRCSVCYKTYDIRAKLNYCPNCGAKMKGESNAE